MTTLTGKVEGQRTRGRPPARWSAQVTIHRTAASTSAGSWSGGGAVARAARMAARVLLALALVAPRRAAHAPCAAAPLCLCADDRFTCDAVQFHRFPNTEAGVRHVSMWGARLGALDDSALDARALQTLVLVACRLGVLQPAALASMRETLASLDLGHNELTEVPHEALRDLKVLNWLSLQHNFISDLDGVEWGGMAETLTSLSLSNNRLTWLRAGSLKPLRALTTLELDGNRIRAVDAGSLPRAIVTLRLSDNLLREPPMLVALPRLQHLTLRDNLIHTSSELETDVQLHALLHTLDLTHNDLDDDFSLELGVRLELRNLLLDLNDFTSLPAFVIECGRLEKLSLSHNRITAMPETLNALASDLRQLDLDYNELVALPLAMNELMRLRRLSAAYNRLREVPSLPPRLYALSLAGNDLANFPEGLTNIEAGTLTHLDLGYNRIAHVGASMFGAWATALDTLSLRGNRLATLLPGAFPPLPLRELALSFNELYSLSSEALSSLRVLSVLELSGTLAGGSMPRAPAAAWLALDNNDIRRVSAADLRAHLLLEHLNLDFNKIVEFPSDSNGWGNASLKLRELRLAYNHISIINGQFLTTLTELQIVDLSYNRMVNVSERTFAYLNNLVFVGLAGNDIECVAAGAFRALPRLQALELQYNHLERFATDVFEHVASEEPNLSVNASHNRITVLAGGGTASISVLDLSYNVLETLPAVFFEGMSSNLRRLLLAHNRVVVLDTLGSLPRLAVLSLRENALEAVRRRALASTPALEELDLTRNRLAILQPEQFRALRRLRVLRLATNQLRGVPPGAFAGTLLEALDLRDNRLSSPPAAAIGAVGFTLRWLELGGNELARLDSAALAGAGFLRELGLARASLRVLPDAAFAGLGRLRRLDLSHNLLVTNFRELLHPVPRLRRLALAGAGLRAVPALPLPTLRELDLSGNAIVACREEDLRVLPELRALNLSNNRLTMLQSGAWAMLPRLAVLDVSHNPLTAIDGLDGLGRLLCLRIQGLREFGLERHALRSLLSVRELELDVGRSPVGAALAGVPQVQALILHVRVDVLDGQLVGVDARKLRALELRGSVRVLSARALAPMARARSLALRLRRSRVGALPALGALARVPALGLELAGNALAALAPATLYPNLTGWTTRATKLLSGGLVVQESGLRCGCGAAWLGAWLRRWTREVGGGARAALRAARRSTCAVRAGTSALLHLEVSGVAAALDARGGGRRAGGLARCAAVHVRGAGRHQRAAAPGG
ncbi:protein artichoke-like [Cydia fagiglandana]|uniref:protein artichoke-like n=1 Tax=Cydia fagiglandana TaxID=1458189 RepID=UPI002FEE3BF8